MFVKNDNIYILDFDWGRQVVEEQSKENGNYEILLGNV